MRYKVGDKVRVRSDLEKFEKYGGYTFTGEMNAYKGMTAAITKVNGNAYAIDLDNKKWAWTDEMFEPVEEMSAVEATEILAEMCRKYVSCSQCPIYLIDKCKTCVEVRSEYPTEVVRILEKWEADHEKKPIETEFIKLVRVIEDTGDCKKCVHEEEIDVTPDKLNAKMEEILKNWCAEHDGKFFAVLERICRVKE